MFNLDELALEAGNEAVVRSALGLSPVAALAFLMFNLFTPPCFAAIGAMNSEIKSKKWLFAAIGLQFSVGFTVSFITYFFGTLLTSGKFETIWMPLLGWTIVFFIVFIFGIAIRRQNLKACEVK